VVLQHSCFTPITRSHTPPSTITQVTVTHQPWVLPYTTSRRLDFGHASIVQKQRSPPYSHDQRRTSIRSVRPAGSAVIRSHSYLQSFLVLVSILPFSRIPITVTRLIPFNLILCSYPIIPIVYMSPPYCNPLFV
jgi:hypothetical protein